MRLLSLRMLSPLEGWGMLLPRDVCGARTLRYLAELEPTSAVGYEMLQKLYTDN